MLSFPFSFSLKTVMLYQKHIGGSTTENLCFHFIWKELEEGLNFPFFKWILNSCQVIILPKLIIHFSRQRENFFQHFFAVIVRTSINRVDIFWHFWRDYFCVLPAWWMTCFIRCNHYYIFGETPRQTFGLSMQFSHLQANERTNEKYYPHVTQEHQKTFCSNFFLFRMPCAKKCKTAFKHFNLYIF